MRLKIIKNHRVILCEKGEYTVVIFLYEVYVILQVRGVDNIAKRFKSAHSCVDKGELVNGNNAFSQKFGVFPITFFHIRSGL
jgi:hypothetical protein